MEFSDFCPLSLMSFSCHHWEESDSTFLTPLSYSPICQFLSCTGEPRPGQITGDVSHQCWVKGEPPLSTCCRNSSYSSSGYCWPPLLRGHITGSYNLGSNRIPRPFSANLFFSQSAPNTADSWCYPSPDARLCSYLCTTSWGSCLFTQPAEILLSRNTSHWSIICKFAEGLYFVTSLR